jgi:O-antigen/teichoic acid export membrane protein
MNLAKKLFGPAVVYGLASQVTSLIQVFILPIVSPYLTKADFGISTVILGYLAMFSAFQYLGLPIIVSNAFYKHRHRYEYLFRASLGLLHIWSVPYCSFIAIILYFVCPEGAQDQTWWIIGAVCLPRLLLGPIDAIGILLFQLKQKPLVILVTTLLTGLIGSAVNMYCIVYLGIGYMGFIYGIAAGAIVQKLSMHYLITYRLGMTPIYTVPWKYWKPRLAISLPLIPHYYAGYLLNSSDRIVMDQLGVSMGDIGIYDGAGKFGNLFNSGSIAINKAVSPLLKEALRDKQDFMVRYLSEVFQLTLFVLTFGVTMLLPEVFPMLIRTPGMEAAIPIAVPIIMAYNYRGMYVGNVSVMFYFERTKKLLRLSFVAGISNVLLNLMFIPYWGFEAAAWSTFVCYLYTGYAGFMLKDYSENIKHRMNWPFWLVLTIALTCLAYFMQNQSFQWRLTSIFAVVIWVAALFWWRRNVMLAAAKASAR